MHYDKLTFDIWHWCVVCVCSTARS